MTKSVQSPDDREYSRCISLDIRPAAPPLSYFQQSALSSPAAAAEAATTTTYEHTSSHQLLSPSLSAVSQSVSDGGGGIGDSSLLAPTDGDCAANTARLRVRPDSRGLAECSESNLSVLYNVRLFQFSLLYPKTVTATRYMLLVVRCT